MLDGGRFLRLLGVLTGATVTGALACSSEPLNVVACSCLQEMIRIEIPGELAGVAKRPVTSGACYSAGPECEQADYYAPDNPCLMYVVPLTANESTCHIEVDFTTGGQFTADVPVVYHDSNCCPGPQLANEEDAIVEVVASHD